MFYEYRQNNSFGRWDVDEDKGIGPIVIIEEATFEYANEKARKIGLYLNGVLMGKDCGCCGDRWSFPQTEEGDTVPCHFNEPIWTSGVGAYGVAGFVHNMDGSIFQFGRFGQDIR